jgi:predicted acyltransferase
MIKKRIESVDVLRGITIIAMIIVNTPGTWSKVYAPFLHAEWHGLTPTDLIFPFFLFIVGISIYFAYKKKEFSISVLKKVFVRSLKLILLGLFLNLFLPYFPFITDLETVRLPGVLQRIGIVFFVTTLLFINFDWKILLSIGFVILLSYWFVLGSLSFSDGTLPTYNRATNNWVSFIDSSILGNHMWKPDYDPEGFLSTFPSIVTCLIGVLIARVLDTMKSINVLFYSAFALIFSGCLLDFWFPINKAIWSSSFVLVTSGIGTLILAVIYYIIDLKKMTFGKVFKYVGMNAITIYFLSSFISKMMYLIKIDENSNLHSFLYTKFFQFDFLMEEFSSLCYAVAVAIFYTVLAYYMYKKKIFINV